VHACVAIGVNCEVEFHPNQISGGRYMADTRTAGSISLLLQISLPVMLFGDRETILELKGGTNCEMAPQIDELTEVFRPNLEKFGASFDFELIKRGYFPRGGGHCRIICKPINSLQPVQMIEFGRVLKLYGWSYVAGTLPIKLAQDICDGAKKKLENFPATIDIEVYKEDVDVARDNCSGIILCAESDKGCLIGGGALGSRKESSSATGEKAALQVLYGTSVGACVDDHVQDQLIIFMALAKGTSRIKARQLTLHTKTAIFVCELMTKAKFNVINDQESTCIIECSGIGLENSVKI